MNKPIIYGVNSNLLIFDIIVYDPPLYFEFNNIKNIIQQYDFIVLLDDVLFLNKQKIIQSIEFLIQNDFDQLLLDNFQPISLEIMEYDYYKRIIKSNRIFKNLTKEDIKQKNHPNNYKPFQFTLQSSIIRTKNFILPNFFLKRNSHIENLYWKELCGGDEVSPLTPPYSCFKIGKIHEIAWGGNGETAVPPIDNITYEIKLGDEGGNCRSPLTPPYSCFKIGKIHEIKLGDEEGIPNPPIDNITHEIAWGGKGGTAVPPHVGGKGGIPHPPHVGGKGGIPHPPPSLTIVTGYLNIKIKRPAKSNTENQTYDYIEKSRGTLQIPQFMVIYCSEELIDNISKIREEFGLQDKTKIIKITLENNLYMADKLDKIRENVAKNNSPYDIPEYILAVNSRYGYIKNAIENNYFNTDYFAWVDFSASHIVNIPPNKIIEPKLHDKIRIGWIARYSNNQFVYNHHCLGGGIFSGHKEIMMELIKLHHSEFVKLMEMGHNINDDKLLFIIMEQYPYLFDTYYSDYKNLFIRL
jgi:hypothetical protein